MKDENDMRDRGKKSHGKKKKRWLVPTVILVVFALLLGGAYAVFYNYYKLSNYVGKSDSITDNPNAVVDSTGLTSDQEATLASEITDSTDDIALPNDSNVYNLLLVGVDRRDTSWSGNSDSMILLSINKSTKTIHMVSFMRDLYANIEGHGVRKLNAACAYGGLPLLVKTIESNYKVDIDNYAWVDFADMVKIIDAIGGVTLDIKDNEVALVNGYSKSMCDAAGVDYTQHQISGAGTIACDGYEAVAYARIRYVGKSDYQRTERQRTVLTKMMEKMKGMNAAELNSFVREILPYVTHDISQTTLLGLITEVPSLLKYSVVKDRIPFDGHFTTQGEILVPDMSYTIQKLQDELYRNGKSALSEENGSES